MQTDIYTNVGQSEAILPAIEALARPWQVLQHL
jgi:hypothetical protein